ncbi:hypothetical protein MARPO_0081s0069 [Marchantia polymorpha]|uniref:Uncharacterized protein n=1 Tax=Marchantia polymorpha TaxID=3197 RepID=A0A2R6WKF8_MARPO|nr:hypothetical protein MARPO_0081s0069 [Marchantia polymorpha]|eukprot:PTQ34346.1 hypothetical protein MARPO_0081s0069 [Marchantia polymorpha]
MKTDDTADDTTLPREIVLPAHVEESVTEPEAEKDVPSSPKHDKETSLLPEDEPAAIPTEETPLPVTQETSTPDDKEPEVILPQEEITAIPADEEIKDEASSKEADVITSTADNDLTADEAPSEEKEIPVLPQAEPAATSPEESPAAESEVSSVSEDKEPEVIASPPTPAEQHDEKDTDDILPAAQQPTADLPQDKDLHATLEKSAEEEPAVVSDSVPPTTEAARDEIKTDETADVTTLSREIVFPAHMEDSVTGPEAADEVPCSPEHEDEVSLLSENEPAAIPAEETPLPGTQKTSSPDEKEPEVIRPQEDITSTPAGEEIKDEASSKEAAVTTSTGDKELTADEVRATPSEETEFPALPEDEPVAISAEESSAAGSEVPSVSEEKEPEDIASPATPADQQDEKDTDEILPAAHEPTADPPQDKVLHDTLEKSAEEEPALAPTTEAAADDTNTDDTADNTALSKEIILPAHVEDTVQEPEAAEEVPSIPQQEKNISPLADDEPADISTEETPLPGTQVTSSPEEKEPKVIPSQEDIASSPGDEEIKEDSSPQEPDVTTATGDKELTADEELTPPSAEKEISNLPEDESAAISPEESPAAGSEVSSIHEEKEPEVLASPATPSEEHDEKDAEAPNTDDILAAAEEHLADTPQEKELHDTLEKSAEEEPASSPTTEAAADDTNTDDTADDTTHSKEILVPAHVEDTVKEPEAAEEVPSIPQQEKEISPLPEDEPASIPAQETPLPRTQVTSTLEEKEPEIIPPQEEIDSTPGGEEIKEEASPKEAAVTTSTADKDLTADEVLAPPSEKKETPALPEDEPAAISPEESSAAGSEVSSVSEEKEPEVIASPATPDEQHDEKDTDDILPAAQEPTADAPALSREFVLPAHVEDTVKGLQAEEEVIGTPVKEDISTLAGDGHPAIPSEETSSAGSEVTPNLAEKEAEVIDAVEDNFVTHADEGVSSTLADSEPAAISSGKAHPAEEEVTSSLEERETEGIPTEREVLGSGDLDEKQPGAILTEETLLAGEEVTSFSEMKELQAIQYEEDARASTADEEVTSTIVKDEAADVAETSAVVEDLTEKAMKTTDGEETSQIVGDVTREAPAVAAVETKIEEAVVDNSLSREIPLPVVASTNVQEAIDTHEEKESSPGVDSTTEEVEVGSILEKEIEALLLQAIVDEEVISRPALQSGDEEVTSGPKENAEPEVHTKTVDITTTSSEGEGVLIPAVVPVVGESPKEKEILLRSTSGEELYTSGSELEVGTEDCECPSCLYKLYLVREHSAKSDFMVEMEAEVESPSEVPVSEPSSVEQEVTNVQPQHKLGAHVLPECSAGNVDISTSDLELEAKHPEEPKEDIISYIKASGTKKATVTEDYPLVTKGEDIVLNGNGSALQVNGYSNGSATRDGLHL